jgi:anti-sigma factor RsiW
MRCDTAKRYLANHAANELGPWRRRALQSHLGRCPDCRSELTALKRTDSLLRRELGAPLAPANMWQHVAAHMDAVPTRTHTSVRAWALGVATAAALLLGLIGTRQQPSAPHQPATEPYAARYVMSSWRDPLADQASLGLMAGTMAQSVKREDR